MTLKEFFSKNRPTTVLIFSLIFSLLTLATNFTNYIRNIRSFLIYFFYFNYIPVYKIFNYPVETSSKFISLAYMYEENLTLKKKLQQLYTENLNLKEIINEYKNKNILNEIKNLSRYKFIESKVIFRDYQTWYNQCLTIINKENINNIKEDLPVLINEDLTKFYLVGRIWKFENNILKILLITNPLSAIPVKIKNKNIECIMIGNSSDKLILDYILPEDEIEIGDIVVTSGINTIPADIEIAQVTKIQSTKPTEFKKAIAKPIFKINNLKNLLILTIN